MASCNCDLFRVLSFRKDAHENKLYSAMSKLSAILPPFRSKRNDRWSFLVKNLDSSRK